MFDKIKRLGTETAIYGISTVLGRFLNFLLVPFYTNVLQPGEYGTVTYVYSFIAFLNIVYGYGMESAYFKYSSTREIGTPGQHFSVPFISLGISSLVFSLFLGMSAPAIGDLAGLPNGSSSIVWYSAWILFFDALAIIPFASLRMEGKAKAFAFIKFLNIAINVASNIVLLLVLRTGIEGIFISGVISSAATFLILIPTIMRRFEFSLSRDLYRALLKFGLPYVPAGLATMIIQVVDRPVLRLLTDDAVLGVYQANYRLGIFMMLIVAMYDYAWRPFFLAHAADPHAKVLFARVLTYLVLLMSILFLLLSFAIPEIVHIRILGRYIIHPDYWSGLSIVPVVLLAYGFLGIYNNLIAGIYIENKTSKLPAITFAGAFVNVAANFALIPVLGMMGAALATLLSYVVMAAVLYFIVQRVYPVRYEFGRLAKIAVALLIVFGCSLIIGVGPYRIVWKTLLLVVFCGLIYWMKFLEPAELGEILGMFKTRGKAHQTTVTPTDMTP